MKRTSGKGIRIAAAAAIFAWAAAGLCGAAPERNLTLIFLSNTAGISEKDRGLTLALDAVAAMKLETLPNVSLIRESEAEMYMASGDFDKLWAGDRDAAGSLYRSLDANVIAIGRHRSAGKWKTASEYRVFYVPPDGTVHTAELKFDLAASGPGELQKKLVEALADRLPPVQLPKDFWKNAPVTNNEQAFSLFGEGLELLRSRPASEAALAALAKAGKADPAFRDLDYFLGKYYATAQYNYERSIQYLKEITGKDPGDPCAHFWLGYVYRLKGEYGPAAGEFSEAARLKPAQYDIYLHLGSLYTDLGDYGKAVESYRAALNVAPHLAPAWYSLASLLALTGDADGALQALRRALELNAETFYMIAGSDADLASVRKLPEFKKLMEEMKP